MTEPGRKVFVTPRREWLEAEQDAVRARNIAALERALFRSGVVRFVAAEDNLDGASVNLIYEWT